MESEKNKDLTQQLALMSIDPYSRLKPKKYMVPWTLVNEKKIQTGLLAICMVLQIPKSEQYFTKSSENQRFVIPTANKWTD